LSYIGSKPANKPVVASDLDPAVITGQTALTSSPAATDEFIISDAGVLKRLDASLIGGGKILQVVQTVKSNTTSATSSATLDTWVDITGISVAVTPSSSSSKIKVSFVLNINSDQAESVAIQILRDTTVIGNGDAASSRLQCFSDMRFYSQYEPKQYTGEYLDSPSTTSAVTYKIQWRKPYDNGSAAIYLNRSYNDSDNNDRPRTSSTITVMEIGA